MKAFHNDPKIKALYLRRIRAHVKADELIRGTGWNSGRGCAVGCTLNAYDHNAYETELGIPVMLAYIEDDIFESLPIADAMRWPEQFLKAISVGADLSKVAAQVCIWQYEDPEYGLQNTNEVKRDPELQRLCSDLVALLKRDAVSKQEYLDIEARAWAWVVAWAGVGAWAWVGAWAGVGAWAWALAGARAWAWEGGPYPVLAAKVLELLKAVRPHGENDDQ